MDNAIARFFFNSVCLVGLVILVIIVHDKYVVRFPVYPDSMQVDMTGSAFKDANQEFLASMRRSGAKEISHLFRKDAPVEKLYEYCRNKRCHRPDLAAFDAMSKWAADPVSYESGVCRYFMYMDDSERGNPSFDLVRGKNTRCVLNNRSEVREARKAYEGKVNLISFLLFMAGLAGIVVMNSKMKR